MGFKLIHAIQHLKRFLGIDETVANDTLKSVCTGEERSRTLETELHDALSLIRITEERSRTLETELHDALSLIRITEERSRTLQHQTSQILYATNYQIDTEQKRYDELLPAMTPGFYSKVAVAAASSILLDTAHPIALTSNDHVTPDSTTEGIVRPTRFVRHCIDVLGNHIRCLDLGAGAAGLIFEYVMHDIVAIGVDGSNYCRRNRVGYWPLLSKNLHTCDITHPFRFRHAQTGKPVNFDVITMWEVLEHIAEGDLGSLLQNVKAHLEAEGYFIGSISLLKYVDPNGNPYHVTLKQKPWWKEKFRENGLSMLDTHPFNESLFCRGNGPRFQDFHNYFLKPEDGFHFVAQLIHSPERNGAP